jgi:hypothetical protein
MADINKRVLDDCDDDREGERGERGKRGKRGQRGHRGHDGHDGDTGPTGPTGPAGLETGGWLKFSGNAQPVAAPNGGPAVTFLADAGNNSPPFSAFPYAVPVSRSLRNLATNLLGIVPANGQITIGVFRDGILIPGFVITYSANETGIKSVVIGPEPLTGAPTPQTLDVRVTVSGDVFSPFPVTAMIGVE